MKVSVAKSKTIMSDIRGEKFFFLLLLLILIVSIYFVGFDFLIVCCCVVESLREACELGSCMKVKEILNRYPTMLHDSCTESGISILIYAVMYNRIEIISHLLSIPSLDVNIREREVFILAKAVL